MDDIPGELDELIREVVVGRTVMGAVTIPDLLLDIDYRLRIRPDREALDAAIRRVVAAGWVRETPDGSLVDGRSSGRVTAQGRPPGDGPPAVVDARRRRAEAGSTSEPPTDEQLLVTVACAGAGAPTPDDWRLAEDLAYRMCQYLADRGRPTRVVALKTSPGRIDFSVLGHATNAPQLLRAMVLPLFETIAPPGSTVVAPEWESWANLPSPTGPAPS